MLKRIADIFNPGAVKFLISTIGLSAAFIVGIVQYVETARRDYRKPFLTAQLELCLGASESAARIAHTTDKRDYDKARTRFLELYWGGLAMVEDQCVTDKMIAFNDELELIGFADVESRSELQTRALHVAFACRRLIAKSWSDIGPLDYGKTGDPRGLPISFKEAVKGCKEDD